MTKRLVHNLHFFDHYDRAAGPKLAPVDRYQATGPKSAPFDHYDQATGPSDWSKTTIMNGLDAHIALLI